MLDKLERSHQIIQSARRHFDSTMVCWSGGKDSMVLLHILRSAGVNRPVIFFREPWQPAKYEFQERVIREWELLVHTWHPKMTAMQQEDDEFEVQNWYQINGSQLTCPTGIVEPAEDLPWACGLEILNRPTQDQLIVDQVDAFWVGHKGCDADPILGGDAGTRIEARLMPSCLASLIFPLRDWSHADVWEYIEKNDVPFDEERYEKVDGEWRERPAKRKNADYVHACTRCLDRRPEASKFVECPMLDMTIENVSSKVAWSSQEKDTYMYD